MIDFQNIDYDEDTVKDIINIGNSCGVIVCYFLSLIYNFKFDIEEFRNIGDGLTANIIRAYAKNNGVNSIATPDSKHTYICCYSNYKLLAENNICVTLSGSNINNNESHISILTDFDKKTFSQLFCNSDDCISKYDEVVDLYLVFFYKDCDINKHVKFKRKTVFDNFIDYLKHLLGFSNHNNEH